MTQCFVDSELVTTISKSNVFRRVAALALAGCGPGGDVANTPATVETAATEEDGVVLRPKLPGGHRCWRNRR
jgi:hypothetical protein